MGWRDWQWEDERPQKGEDRRQVGRYMRLNAHHEGRGWVSLIHLSKDRMAGLVHWSANMRGAAPCSSLIDGGHDPYDVAKREAVELVERAVAERFAPAGEDGGEG